ncbi:uncharacterized protein [Dermacentor albipictus]|uniref:uncharacterized protein n=1 Tax=Dermacentor albipictus TaxID=60249 RepID=UPI0031FD6084
MARTSAVLPLSLLSLKCDNVDAETVIFTCTRGQTRFCHLQQHLRLFNKVLWNLGLQLREDARSQLGDVSVATVSGVCKMFPHCTKCHSDQEAAITLLRCLFRAHRCIVSAELNYAVANAGTLAEALETSPSLESLAVFGVASDQPELFHEFAAKAYSLDCSGVSRFPQGYAHSLDSMKIPFHLMAQRDARLTSLDVAELQMSPFTSKKLVKALITNHTITDVAVGQCVFASGPCDGSSQSFEDYLLKQNATLRKLTLRGPQFNNEYVWLQALAEAIAAMTTLQELYAQWLGKGRYCKRFATVVSRNRLLRCLTLRLDAMYNVLDEQQRDEDVEAADDRPWISAVKENDSLQKLDLDVSWSTTENCCLLLEALANKQCLQSVTLRDLPDVDRLEEVCSAIRKSGLVHNVSIADYYVDHIDTPTLSDFPEVTAVTVYLPHSEDAAAVQRFFHRLVASNYISSLHVTVDFLDKICYGTLATYIKSASALKEIRLDIDVDIDDYIDEWDDENLAQSISDMCTALSSNLSLTKITLEWSVDLRDKDCQVLAGTVFANRRLHELTLKLDADDYRAAFLRHLLPRFHQNYSLLRLEIPFCLKPYPNSFAVQDIVRRNCSLVERATRFVLGDQDPYCACAVELVSEHPKLVDNVRRRAALSDEAAAVASIRKGLRSLRLADVHEFMRLVGVVQRRVVCHAREDGVTQFDRLNHECWLHIRRYLIVADVLKP